MINLIHKITIHPRKNFLVVNNLAKWHQLLICTAINRTDINLTGKFRTVKHMNGKNDGHICHFCPHFSVQIFVDKVYPLQSKM